MAWERRQMEDQIERMELRLKKMTADNREVSEGIDISTHLDSQVLEMSYSHAQRYEGSQREIETSQHASLLGNLDEENATR